MFAVIFINILLFFSDDQQLSSAISNALCDQTDDRPESLSSESRPAPVPSSSLSITNAEYFRSKQHQQQHHHQQQWFPHQRAQPNNYNGVYPHTANSSMNISEGSGPITVGLPLPLSVHVPLPTMPPQYAVQQRTGNHIVGISSAPTLSIEDQVYRGLYNLVPNPMSVASLDGRFVECNKVSHNRFINLNILDSISSFQYRTFIKAPKFYTIMINVTVLILI